MRTIKSPITFLASFLLIFVFGFFTTASADPCKNFGFGDPNYFPGGLTPNGLATADFNGDGKADLAAANEGSGNVMVRFGDGAGGFPTAIQLTVASPSSIVAADLNGDGLMDLAASNRSINLITVWLNLGGGAFGSATQFATGQSPSGIAAADLNGDGKRDLITSNGGDNTVSVLLGSGSGSFPTATAFALAGATGPSGLTVADFNHDGMADVATANRGVSSLSIRFGNGLGGFSSGATYATGTLPMNIASGDFNGDGAPDVVTANNGSANLTVRLNNGSGALLAPLTLAAGNQAYSVSTGDLDGSGSVDIIVTNRGSNNLSVFLGNGNGTFASRVDHALSAGPRSLLVADLNGDQSLDMATGIDSGLIGVLLNNCSSNTPPTISSGTVTRQQDGGSSRSVIATVSDAQDAPASLMVTIDGGTSSSKNGVTIANISVDAAGAASADVSASCGASNASFVLRVIDSVGLSAEATLVVDVINEATPPVINNGMPLPSITAYLPLNSPDVSMPVKFSLPSATDNCSASPSVVASPESGATFGVGSTTVAVTATDDLGNEATTTFEVKVLFNFGGLLAPIDPFPAQNVAVAGSSVPIKFSLSGNKGLNIFATGYPASSAISCGADDPGAVEIVDSPGNSGLKYDPVSDEYSLTWKTSKDWKRSCRMLVIRLADGTDHLARFSFR